MVKVNFIAKRKKKRKETGMIKEIIIIIVVVALVIGIDIISNNFLKESVIELSNELNKLKVQILEENQEKAQKQMQIVRQRWKEKYKVLAYYIEHDELEKVETELVRLASDIDMEDYKHCINELNTAIFILEHIEQKEKLDIISIF